LRVQNSAHGGVLTNQVGFSGAFAFARRTHLTTFLGIGVGLLPSGIEQANALQGHMQAGGVHHHEHRAQALAGLAHY
jgi:hypothetical protein